MDLTCSESCYEDGCAAGQSQLSALFGCVDIYCSVECGGGAGACFTCLAANCDSELMGCMDAC